MREFENRHFHSQKEEHTVEDDRRRLRLMAHVKREIIAHELRKKIARKKADGEICLEE